MVIYCLYVGDKLMSEILTLYHGSEKIIESPEFRKGNLHNDFGLGFYCTENLELAKEWACSSRSGGVANTYSFPLSGLSVLDLTDQKYSILDWLTVLVNNRVFDLTNQMAVEAKEYLTKHFLHDIDAFDAVKGYRADDSYFTFASDFLSGTISLRQLSNAMSLGSLGEQFTLKSKKAFDLLQFLGCETVDGGTYFAKRRNRDRNAREQYLKRERKTIRNNDDIFMLDILREEIDRGDARLQRNLSP